MKLPIQQKERIQTERLKLKPYTLQDLEPLVALITNEAITRTFMVLQLETEDQAFSLARKLIAYSRPEDTAHLEYGIYLDDRLIGFINDCGIRDEEIEIGYVIHPDEQGHGYATEAVKAVISELREMGFRKVTAGYFVENTASRRVMEKCGMKQSDQTEEIEYRGRLHQCRYHELFLS